MADASWPVILGGWVIAGITTVLLWRQSQTGREQLRYQLFDKRVVIYHDVVDQMRTIVQRGDCDDESINNLHSLIKKATFLFGRDVLDHLEEQASKAIGLHTANKILEDAPTSDQRSSHTKKRNEIVGWFFDDLGQISNLFEPYLGFSHQQAKRKLDFQQFKLICEESATRIWSFCRKWQAGLKRSAKSSQ